MIAAYDRNRCGGLDDFRVGCVLVSLAAKDRALGAFHPELGGIAVQRAGDILADYVIIVRIDALRHFRVPALLKARVQVLRRPLGLLGLAAAARPGPPLDLLPRLGNLPFFLLEGLVEELVEECRLPGVGGLWSLVPLGSEEHTLKPDYTFLLTADFHPQPLILLLKFLVCRLLFHITKILNFNELAKFSRRYFSCFQHNFYLCFRLLGNAFCAGHSAIFLL